MYPIISDTHPNPKDFSESKISGQDITMARNESKVKFGSQNV